MPYRIAKIFNIECGHIISKHPGKCRFPHGHSHRVEVVLAADTLDAHDMVCDFQAVKQMLHDFLDGWDHALCLNTDDPHFAFFSKNYGAHIVPFGHTDPTSEVMARTIFAELKRALAAAQLDAAFQPPLQANVRVERVRITETETSWAEYSE
ncbi:MAG: 6-carboxytetrahydropterin synthase [Opitutaceae bacterium]|nr:6-carboxytetrahydropterin synthase [Opitutaceae bacterium]